MLELIKDHLNVDAITGTQSVFEVGLDVEVDENLQHMNQKAKPKKNLSSRKKEANVAAFKPKGDLSKSDFG